MKPKLTREQKMVLTQELLEWALNNPGVMAADSPRLHTFQILQSIQIDEISKVRANNNHVIIKELKQNGLLWVKLLPFLENEKSDCKTKIDTEDKGLYNTCHHGIDDHDPVTGKCMTTYSVYDKGNHWKLVGQKKCPCQHYKTNQTW